MKAKWFQSVAVFNIALNSPVAFTQQIAHTKYFASSSEKNNHEVVLSLCVIRAKSP